MDHLETRIAALELLALELLADAPPEALKAAHARIHDGLAGALGEDERMIRKGAMGLINDAVRRHDLFLGGPTAEND